MNPHLVRPSNARTRYLAQIDSPRMKGWVELQSASRVTAKVECAGVFEGRGVTVTLWERDEADAPHYFRIGVVVSPAKHSTVEGRTS